LLEEKINGKYFYPQSVGSAKMDGEIWDLIPGDGKKNNQDKRLAVKKTQELTH